jgi:WD40 repeat protein
MTTFVPESYDSELYDDLCCKESSNPNESRVAQKDDKEPLPQLDSISVETDDLNGQALADAAEAITIEIQSNFAMEEDEEEEIPAVVAKSNALSIQSDGNGLIYGHIGRITAICQLSDGSLATGSDFPDKTIRIWSLPTSTESTCEQIIKCPHKILSLLALPNNRIAAGLGNKTIRVFNTMTGALMTDWHSGLATCLALLPDSNILSSSSDNTMKIWRKHDGAYLGTLRGHTGAVTCCIVVNETDMIISGSKDCTINLWQLKTNKKEADCMNTLTGHSSGISSVCITGHGTLLSAAMNEIRMWDMTSFSCTAVLDGLCPLFSVSSNLPLVFHPIVNNPQSVVVIGWGTAKDHSILAKILDTQTRQITKEITDPERSKSKERIFCVTVLQDGRVVVAGDDKVLRVLQS